MLSVLAYKLRKKSAVVKMLTTDPGLTDIGMDGGDGTVRLPPQWRVRSETPILPHLGFTDA